MPIPNAPIPPFSPSPTLPLILLLKQCHEQLKGTRGVVQHLANRILEQHGKNTDDALVLVVRYLGGAT